MTILINKKYFGNIEEMNFLGAVDPQSCHASHSFVGVLIPKVPVFGDKGFRR